jgi:hypothetical protein
MRSGPIVTTDREQLREAPKGPGLSLKAIVVPAEHGAWGFLAEPLLLGLLVAPSRPAGLLALVAIAAFLARQPLRLLAGDILRRRAYPRTRWAAAFFVGFALVAAFFFVLAAHHASSGFWLPLALAAPLFAIQLAHDARNRGRALTAELSGAAAAGALATAIALASGWDPAAAWPLWALMAARSVPSVLYVRARLLLARRGSRPTAAVHAAHLAALAAGTSLALAGRAPRLAVVALAALSLRSVHGLSPRRRPVRPQVVGLQEVAHGAFFVAAIAAGYALGL